MAKQTKRRKVKPLIGAITDSDFGLKVAVKYSDKPEEAGYVPIIGWASVSNYIQANTYSFAPIIRGPNNMPMMASAATIKGFQGIYPKNAVLKDLLMGMSGGPVE